MRMNALRRVFFLGMVFFPKVSYNMDMEERFFFKGLCQFLKSIFICLRFWDPILNEFSDEVYERILGTGCIIIRSKQKYCNKY
jgi:hypothetical protein